MNPRAPESDPQRHPSLDAARSLLESGLSVILFALQALSRAAPDHFARLPVRFICNTDEEVGSPSSLPMKPLRE